jgi:hypothetical protein
MANKKISDLVATSPVANAQLTDQYETNQGGVSKGGLLSQLLKLINVHANVAAVTVTSAMGETTLLDSAATAAMNQGTCFIIEAFGDFVDPGVNNPQVVFNLYVSGVNVATVTQTIGGGQWYFKALVTVRAAGIAGTVAAAIAVIQDSAAAPFPFNESVAVINTTGTPAINVTGTIQNFLGTEAIHCYQLLITRYV